MTWQVIQYMDENPQSSPKEVIAHFAKELEVDQQIAALTQEVAKVLEIREKLRPLYAEKTNAETATTLLNSEFDMQVMAKFPPRQGSDKERKAYKLHLQQEHESFMQHQAKIDQCKGEIELLEESLQEVQQRAKNARRILETFNAYMNYLLVPNGLHPSIHTDSSVSSGGNGDIF